MKRIILSLLLFTTMTAIAVADGDNFGSASFLKHGIGGRAAGMAGAFTGLADDATAAYWNPAGLAQLDLYLYQAGAQYIFLPNDVSSSYLGYAFQIPNTGTFAISWMNSSVSNFNKYDESANEIGTFGASENAWIISYGKKVYEWIKGLKIGANIKILSNSINDSSAIGHGMDIGVQWQPILYWDHIIGINIQNLFQRLYWDNSIEPSLVTAKLGVALKFMPSDDELYFNKFISTIDAEITEFSRIYYCFGIEYWPVKRLAFRAGINSDEVTGGLSYKPNYYQIDYAFHYDFSNISSHQHRVSVLLRFK